MRHVLVLLLGLLACAPLAARAQPSAQVQRGEYLVRAADCIACHSVAGRPSYTGGRGFVLPFGTLYSPNITPDPQTGIGQYSDDDFVRMLRQGVARGGRHLYPAMPYNSYTLLNRDDALAIKAYLFSLAPVRIMVPENRMRFPFNQRWTLAFWNILNNPDHRFRPDATKPEEWNRGAYLVEALGHCAQCHTPRNVMQGLSGRAYAGTRQEGWLAYNLTADPASGLGGWSDAALEQYLSSGHAVGHGPASGPMAEAVQDSLRYLTPRDIHAMVVYLRTIPARADGPPAVQEGAVPASSPDNPLGARIFIEACAGCHLPNGQGRQSPWAALAGDHSTGDPRGTNLVQVLAHGTQIETDRGLMFMHAFTRSYTDPELAAVANYVVAQFGGRSGTITPEQIRAARGGREPAVASGLFGVPLAVWAGMVLVLVVIGAAVVWLVLRGPPAPLRGTAGRS